MGVPLYVICHFSLVTFNILSLSLTFVSLITMCVSHCVPPWIYPAWDSALPGLVKLFPLHPREIFIHYSNIFLGPFSLSSPSGTPIMQMLGHLMLSQRSLMLSSFFVCFHSFFYILSCGSDFHHAVLRVPYLFFCLSYSATDSFWRIIHLCLFFSSSRSLVNISCIFSILRSWIIFTVIILSSYSGRLLTPTSFSCFSGVLSCPFIWDITFCFFMLINFL